MLGRGVIYYLKARACGYACFSFMSHGALVYAVGARAYEGGVCR